MLNYKEAKVVFFNQKISKIVIGLNLSKNKLQFTIIPVLDNVKNLDKKPAIVEKGAKIYDYDKRENISLTIMECVKCFNNIEKKEGSSFIHNYNNLNNTFNLKYNNDKKLWILYVNKLCYYFRPEEFEVFYYLLKNIKENYYFYKMLLYSFNYEKDVRVLKSDSEDEDNIVKNDKESKFVEEDSSPFDDISDEDLFN